MHCNGPKVLFEVNSCFVQTVQIVLDINAVPCTQGERQTLCTNYN